MLNSRVHGKRDRDKSHLGCLGLRNWRKKTNNTFFVLFVFLKVPKKMTFGRRLFERGWDKSV